MADTKISALTAKTTVTGREYVPIVDPDETAAADQNKRYTIDTILSAIVVFDDEVVVYEGEVVYY